MKMKILIIFLFFTGIIFISYVKSNKEEINYTIIGEKELFSNNIISKNFSDLIYDELSKKNNFGFYSKEFIYKNISTIDMINNINNNVSGLDISNINIFFPSIFSFVFYTFIISLIHLFINILILHFYYNFITYLYVENMKICLF